MISNSNRNNNLITPTEKNEQKKNVCVNSLEAVIYQLDGCNKSLRFMS